TMTVNGRSATGGNIDFNTQAISTTFGLDSRGTSSAAGGAITLAAFAQGGSTGQVLLPFGLAVTSGGSGGSASGNVTMTGEGGITIGAINTTGGFLGTGNISLRAGTPSTTAVTINKIIGSLSGFTNNGPYTSATVAAANLTANGSTVTLTGN